MTLPLIGNTLIQFLITALFLVGMGFGAFSSARYWRRNLSEQKFLIDRINDLLPQTQCGQCGHEGCLPYARAIAQGTAINQCPPGGEETIRRLALLLNEPPKALNSAHGKFEPARVAVIREDECIGCTKCIKACPVDAIVGGAKLMHTVIASECTGCDLCIDPCPVDCIDMVPGTGTGTWRWQTATSANSLPSLSQVSHI